MKDISYQKCKMDFYSDVISTSFIHGQMAGMRFRRTFKYAIAARLFKKLLDLETPVKSFSLVFKLLLQKLIIH